MLTFQTSRVQKTLPLKQHLCCCGIWPCKPVEIVSHLECRVQWVDGVLVAMYLGTYPWDYP